MQTGTYNYFLNGEPTGVIETFESKILSNSSKQTTSTRDATPFNTIIAVGTLEKDDKFQNCKIVYQKDESKIEADYEFSEKSFQVLRKINGEIVQNETFDLPEKAIFFPLMRYFQGQTILQVAKNQDVTTVIVPDIKTSTNFENLLQPTFDERTAKFIKRETIAFYQPESVSIEADLYQYLSKHYDDNSQFWINDEGFLVAYQFVQSADKIWTIQLQS